MRPQCVGVWLAILCIGAAVSEELADLSPLGDTAPELVELGEGHLDQGDVQLLHGNDVGQSMTLSPAEEAIINGTASDDTDNTLTSANPFLDDGQGPAQGSAGVAGDASDQSAGTSDDDVSSNYDKTTTLDASDKEEQQHTEEQSEELQRKEAIADNIGFDKNSPLSLAGQSGVDTRCTVHDDSVTVSGRGEAACLFASDLIFRNEKPVEIAFDLEFGNVAAGSQGRHGGIFYGASQNTDSHTENPTVDWIDAEPGRGYRVYGNKDVNKLTGMTPGPDPNQSWKITIFPDGIAEFTAGPKTWVKRYTPLIKGPYFGFFTTSGALKITNVHVREAHRPEMQEKSTRMKGLKIVAEEGYGVGSAQLFYSETGGDSGKVMPKSMYVAGNTLHPRDLRTQTHHPGSEGGSIVASDDLHAGRFLEIQATEGFQLSEDGFRSSTRLFYTEQGKGNLNSETVYLAQGNFEMQHGSVVATNDVKASRQLLLGAEESTGETAGDAPDAAFWYAQVGKEEEGVEAATLHLRKGDFTTAKGDFEASEDVTADEYLTLREDETSGDGEAKFWYSQDGMEEFDSETAYLENGHFATAQGDIVSSGDVVAKRFLKINAKEFYGDGHAKLFYIAKGSGKYTSNTLYTSSSLGTETGSIQSAKDLVTNHYLRIGTGNARTTHGGADLWYCHRSTAGANQQENGLQDTSLYLESGDFKSKAGSILAATDLVATRELYFASAGDAFANVKSARAKLWYAHKDSGEIAGETLYLRQGSFATEDGDIISPENLVTKKYVSLTAMEGYGTTAQDKIQLFYSSKQVNADRESVLYIKSGSLRLQDGSIYADDIGTSRELQVGAMDGFGTGTAAFFYVDASFNDVKFSSKSLYLKGTVNFHVEKDIFAKQHLIATKSVKIEALEGFGNGVAELWFGREGGASGALNTALSPDTMYLREGSFSTEKGDLHAHLDVETRGGVFMLAARDTPEKMSADTKQTATLWYSETGSTPTVGSKSLYLHKGDFATASGSIQSAKHVWAHPSLGSLKGSKAQLTGGMQCDTCEFGNIFILPESKQKKTSPHLKSPMVVSPDSKQRKSKPLPKTVLEDAMVLLDEEQGPVIDLEQALRKMTVRHTELKGEHASLVDMLTMAKRRLSTLEGALAARR